MPFVKNVIFLILFGFYPLNIHVTNTMEVTTNSGNSYSVNNFEDTTENDDNQTPGEDCLDGYDINRECLNGTCRCKEGYAIFMDCCKACNIIGPNCKCAFVKLGNEYEKRCACLDGFVPNEDDTCVAITEDSKNTDVIGHEETSTSAITENGKNNETDHKEPVTSACSEICDENEECVEGGVETLCECKIGYVKLAGSCTECKVSGKNCKCEFVKDEKDNKDAPKCICLEGFVLKDNVCTAPTEKTTDIVEQTTTTNTSRATHTDEITPSSRSTENETLTPDENTTTSTTLVSMEESSSGTTSMISTESLDTNTDVETSTQPNSTISAPYGSTTSSVTSSPKEESSSSTHIISTETSAVTTRTVETTNSSSIPEKSTTDSIMQSTANISLTPDVQTISSSQSRKETTISHDESTTNSIIVSSKDITSARTLLTISIEPSTEDKTSERVSTEPKSSSSHTSEETTTSSSTITDTFVGSLTTDSQSITFTKSDAFSTSNSVSLRTSHSTYRTTASTKVTTDATTISIASSGETEDTSPKSLNCTCDTTAINKEMMELCHCHNKKDKKANHGNPSVLYAVCGAIVGHIVIALAVLAFYKIRRRRIQMTEFSYVNDFCESETSSQASYTGGNLSGIV